MNLKRIKDAIKESYPPELTHEELVKNITEALPHVKNLSVITFEQDGYRFEVLPWKEKEDDELGILIRVPDPIYGDYIESYADFDMSPEEIAEYVELVVPPTLP